MASPCSGMVPGWSGLTYLPCGDSAMLRSQCLHRSRSRQANFPALQELQITITISTSKIVSWHVQLTGWLAAHLCNHLRDVVGTCMQSTVQLARTLHITISTCSGNIRLQCTYTLRWLLTCGIIHSLEVLPVVFGCLHSPRCPILGAISPAPSDSWSEIDCGWHGSICNTQQHAEHLAHRNACLDHKGCTYERARTLAEIFQAVAGLHVSELCFWEQWAPCCCL